MLTMSSQSLLFSNLRRMLLKVDIFILQNFPYPNVGTLFLDHTNITGATPSPQSCHHSARKGRQELHHLRLMVPPLASISMPA